MTVTLLNERVADLVHVATLVCDGFRAGLSNDEPLTEDTHARLATAVERTPEFQDVVSAAFAQLPEDRSVDDLPPIIERLERARDTRILDWSANVRAFMRRSRFYLNLWNGTIPDPSEPTQMLVGALGVAALLKVDVVPIDGLAIRGERSIDLGGMQLVEMSRNEWEAFFETDLFYPPSIPTEDLDSLWCIRREGKHKKRGWGMPIDLFAPRSRAMREYGNWLRFASLWSLGSVRPVGLLQHIASPLAEYPVYSRIAETPWLDPISGEDGEVYYRPHVTVQVDDASSFRDFLLKLAAGHEAARGDGRLDAALRFFDRTCFGQFGAEPWHIGLLERDVLEDFITDSCTCLEAALLDGMSEREKKNRLAQRIAALVAVDEGERKKVCDEVASAYETRSAIVHGDAPRPQEALAVAAKSLLVRTRQVLVALIMLNGDRTLFHKAVSDRSERARLRTHLRLYPE